VGRRISVPGGPVAEIPRERVWSGAGVRRRGERDGLRDRRLRGRVGEVDGQGRGRTTRVEELEGRRRVHVALSEAATAPDVFQELRERIVTVRGRRLVRQLRRRTAEGHVDVRTTRVRLVEPEDERGLLRP